MISQKYPQIIVFDIETIGNVSDPHFVENMQLTVVGTYNYLKNEYKAYFREDLPELEADLKKTNMLVGFNNDHFDTPILNKYYSFDLQAIASFDILREFRQVTGRRIGLDVIASMTIGARKSGTGLNAMKLYEEGKLQDLAEYCLQDVKLTKQLFDYMLQHQHLIYPSRDGWLRLKAPTPIDIDSFIQQNSQKSQYQLF